MIRPCVGWTTRLVDAAAGWSTVRLHSNVALRRRAVKPAGRVAVSAALCTVFSSYNQNVAGCFEKRSAGALRCQFFRFLISLETVETVERPVVLVCMRIGRKKSHRVRLLCDRPRPSRFRIFIYVYFERRICLRDFDRKKRGQEIIIPLPFTNQMGRVDAQHCGLKWRLPESGTRRRRPTPYIKIFSTREAFFILVRGSLSHRASLARHDYG